MIDKVFVIRHLCKDCHPWTLGATMLLILTIHVWCCFNVKWHFLDFIFITLKCNVYYIHLDSHGWCHQWKLFSISLYMLVVYKIVRSSRRTSWCGTMFCEGHRLNCSLAHVVIFVCQEGSSNGSLANNNLF